MAAASSLAIDPASAHTALLFHAIQARAAVITALLELLHAARDPLERRRLCTVLLRATAAALIPQRAHNPPPTPSLDPAPSPPAARSRPGVAPSPPTAAATAPTTSNHASPAADPPRMPGPSPDLSPQAVVRAVTDAFGDPGRIARGEAVATLARFLADDASIHGQALPTLPPESELPALAPDSLAEALADIDAAAQPILADLPGAALTPDARPFLSPTDALVRINAHRSGARRSLAFRLCRSRASRAPGCWLISRIAASSPRDTS